jgi:hypothetical protein
MVITIRYLRKNKMNPTLKATQLLLALDKQGANVQTFAWAFTTGRLAPLEWEIMTYVKAGNLAATNEALKDAYRMFYQSLKEATIEELTVKKWLSKGSLALASKIAKAKWFKND